jgi:peptide/nickel transport system permease protein
MDVYVVPPDVPPSWEYPLGTTSRGQDVFWQLTFAIRNTLLFGIVVAVLSRIISLGVGLISGYKGGWVDRVLMSINDTFVVIPLFPILVLFYFIMRDQMSWAMLAVITALLGWAYEPEDPRIHPPSRVLRYGYRQDRSPGTLAVRSADRVLDDHEQHQLVDRH